MKGVEGMNRLELLELALGQAPGRPIVVIRPIPVQVRFVVGFAAAYTVTHVLVEWDADGEPNVRWEASWQVKRVSKGL